MRTKYFSILSLLFLAINSYSQNSLKKELFNPIFNWKITIPENFEYVSAEEVNKLKVAGEEAVEKTYGEEMINQSKQIFAFNSGKFNYFESSYQPFDVTIDGDYITTCKSVNNILYETINSQMPGSKIDTTFTKEIIDKLEFQKFNLRVQLPNGIIMNMIMYSRLFDKKELAVNIIYIDDKKGKQMLESWKQSTFSK